MSAIASNGSLDRIFRGWVLRAFGHGAAKRAAPWADVSYHAVEGWQRCRREPGAWALLKMARHPAFRAELRAYLDHIEMEEANIASQVEDVAPQRQRSADCVASPSGAPQRTAAACTTAQGLGDTDGQRS